MSVHDVATIADHYAACWGSRGNPVPWSTGPIWQLPPGFCILSFAPNDDRRRWTYGTCGMSLQGDAPALELHLHSPVESLAHVELLTAIAHYHLTGAYLGLGHTVNFGRPWLPKSLCDHGLISLPFLDGPKLENLQGPAGKIRFLWLLPVTAEEVKFKKAFGSEALEQRFEAANFNYLEPFRKSVV